METGVTLGGQIVNLIFSTFTDVISGLASGLQTAFNQVLYVNGTASDGLSPIVEFLLIFGGITLGMGILWKLFGLVRGKTKA